MAALGWGVRSWGALHRGTGGQSNWGGSPRGYVVGELGPSRERVGEGEKEEGREADSGPSFSFGG